jgi:hypothetical protein
MTATRAAVSNCESLRRLIGNRMVSDAHRRAGQDGPKSQSSISRWTVGGAWRSFCPQALSTTQSSVRRRTCVLRACLDVSCERLIARIGSICQPRVAWVRVEWVATGVGTTCLNPTPTRLFPKLHPRLYEPLLSSPTAVKKWRPAQFAPRTLHRGLLYFPTMELEMAAMAAIASEDRGCGRVEVVGRRGVDMWFMKVWKQ